MTFFFCNKCGKIFSAGQNSREDVLCPACGGSRKKDGAETITELTLPDTGIGDCRIIRPLYIRDAVISCLAEQSSIGRQVRAEILDTSSPEGKKFQQDFLANARRSVKSRHTHIVSALNAGRTGELLYCIYPHFSGRTLADILDTGKIYSPETALSLVRDIAEGMLFMWKKQGAFHGMLNPENILLTDDGDTILTDFWRAVQIKNLFTPAYGKNIVYLSPEHAAGSNLSFQCDIYALGAILYRMTTGKIPFKDIPVERLKGTILLNRSFIPQEEISRQTDIPREFLHLIQRMCVRNQPESISSWEEYLAESEKTLQNLLTGKAGKHYPAPQAVPVIQLKAVQETLPRENYPNSGKNRAESSFARMFRKYLLYIAIFIFAGGLCAATYHIFYTEKLREIVPVPAEKRKKVSVNRKQQPPPTPVQNSVSPSPSPNTAEDNLQTAPVKTEVKKVPEKKRVHLSQDPVFRQMQEERHKLFRVLGKAGIMLTRDKYRLRKMPHELLMQKRAELCEYLKKIDDTLNGLAEKYPESKLPGLQKRYMENIRRKVDECYADYDKKVSEENVSLPEKEEKTATVETAEKDIPAKVAEKAVEEPVNNPGGQQPLAEYRKKYAELFAASCRTFMNSGIFSDQNITEQERMKKYTANFPAPPPEAEKRKVEKIRKKYNALFSTLAEAEFLAGAFYSYLGSSGEKYRNTILSVERKKSIIWRIKNSRVTLRQANSPAAKVCSLPELGRYNLALLAVHVSEKSENMQKYCFPFLLKIHAYKQAEKYAVTREEKQLLAILKNNFPAWAENKDTLLLLKQDLKNLPADRVTEELRKQIEEIEEDLPVVRKERKSSVPIPRRANYAAPSGPVQHRTTPERDVFQNETDFETERSGRRRQSSRERTVKTQKKIFDRE